MALAYSTRILVGERTKSKWMFVRAGGRYEGVSGGVRWVSQIHAVGMSVERYSSRGHEGASASPLSLVRSHDVKNGVRSGPLRLLLHLPSRRGVSIRSRGSRRANDRGRVKPYAQSATTRLVGGHEALMNELYF